MEKKQLRQLLAQNRIERLLEALHQLAEEQDREDLQEELFQLEGRWKAYKEKENQGLATFQELSVEHNRIRKALSAQIKKAFQAPKKGDQMKRKPLFWPLLIAAACLLLTLIGYIPNQKGAFILEAEAPFVQVTLAEEWDIDFDFYMNQFETDQLEALVLPDTSIEAEDPNLRLTATGRQIQLAEMILPAEATIDLFNEKDNAWQLDVKDQSVYGALELIDASINIEQEEAALLSQSFPPNPDGSPEIVEFQTSVGASFFADICEDCAFKIERLGVSAVQFSWSPDKAEFESSIQAGGSLKVTNSSTIELKTKDEIELAELSNTYLTLALSPNGFKVFLEGNAGIIRHGFKGKFKSLKPNLIQSIANNGNAKLFYTTLVWLLGIGLGIWTTVGKFKKEKN